MLRERARHLFAVVLVCGAMVGAAVRWWPRSVHNLAPANAFLVAELDWKALSQTPLRDPLVEWMNGLGEVNERCGIKIEDRLSELTLSIADGEPEFGLAVDADVSKVELANCKGDWKGDGTAKADGYEAYIGKGFAVAVSPHGPVLVSTQGWADRMVEAAASRDPSPIHRRLRDEVLADFRGRTIVTVSVKISDRMRKQIPFRFRILGDQTEQALANIDAFALAVSRTDKNELLLRADIHCDTETSCHSLREMALAQRLSLSQNLKLRLAGASTLIDHFAATVAGNRLRLETSDDLSRTADLIRKVISWGGPSKKQHKAGEKDPANTPAPDLRIPAKPSAESAKKP